MFSARMVYSFVSYSDLIYEITVHASKCTGSKAVKIGLSLYTYLVMHNSCTHAAHIGYRVSAVHIMNQVLFCRLVNHCCHHIDYHDDHGSRSH